jgi:hypothetical protein
VSRIAIATAFTCAIVFASDDANARGRFRLFSSSPKPAAASTLKPVAGPTTKPGIAADGLKPFAAAKPANPQPVGGGTLVVIGGPRPAAGQPGLPAQRAVGDDAAGPLQFDPSLAAASEKAAAKPATECLTTPQAIAAKEPLPGAMDATKDQVAANEPPKVEPAPPHANPALVPVKPKRQAAAVVATVCYVQRDGSCVPSY